MSRPLPVAALSALSAAALLLGGCWLDAGPGQLVLTGETMGTSFSVLAVDPPDGVTEAVLADRLDAVLEDVNAKLSNWDPGSEISRFNAAATTDPVPISADLATVIARAEEIHALSEGRFDVTVAPLVALWGFGPRRAEAPQPDADAIAAALDTVGQARMLTLAGASLAKSRPDVTVDLSAIAKGYGVDRVAQALREAGIERYIVEIGGDLAARGLSAGAEPWIIGIETPQAPRRTDQPELQTAIEFGDGGLATSGDYRNAYDRDGVRHSHIIDPTTGRPVAHDTASVTAIAEDAMSADALATAFLVLGAEAGLPLANARGLAILFVERAGDGFVTRASDSFPPLLSEPR